MRVLTQHFMLNNVYNQGSQPPESGFWPFYPTVLIPRQYLEGIGSIIEVTFVAILSLFSHSYSKDQSLPARVWVFKGWLATVMKSSTYSET